MDRRRFVSTGLAAVTGSLAGPLVGVGRARPVASGPAFTTRAIDLVLSSPVIDMLGLVTMDWPKLGRWYHDPSLFDLAEFLALQAVGVDVYHTAVEPAFRDPGEGVRWWLHRWSSLVDHAPCFLSRVDGVSDLVATPGDGRIGLLLGFQNSAHFREVADVGRFHDLGQRVSQLTYNGRNRLGSGCQAEDLGLTAFGAEIVAEMNRLGMAVDISHCGDRTSSDAIEASSKPVLVTHSNCRALVPGQRRNKPDDLIRRVARSGGVMGISVVRAFVGHGSPSLDDLLDHFDHVARLVGPEHLGIGSDVSADAVDPAIGRPRRAYDLRGLDLALRVFQIADGLLARGWTTGDVALVLGGSFRRALADIWEDRPWDPLPDDPRLLRRDPFCPAPKAPRPRERPDSAPPRIDKEDVVVPLFAGAVTELRVRDPGVGHAGPAEGFQVAAGT